ncbi:MAG: glycosyltransferase family 2 protein [Firmicutes bacterium]|nr:glycosyltransferase family 2 protein [Bacillota bacterium]
MEYLADLIIVSFNTRKYLNECLQSIKEQTPLNREIRVLVVDNCSVDGSVEMIKANRWVQGIYNQKNRGYGAACNQGIRSGNGKYIFLLNSDTRVTSGWLQPLIKTLESTEVAVVGPRLVNPEGYLVGVGVVGANSKPVLRGWGEPDEPDRYSEYCECLSVGGACMGIKRELLPELGYFDEHYFHYFEETDYCYNARYHGYKVIYCPASKVIHRVYGSCQNMRILNDYFSKSREYFQKKWKEFLNDETVYGRTFVGDVAGSE